MRRAPTSLPNPHERLAFLEGLRGLAALYVVLGHICSLADPSYLAGQKSKAPDWFQSLASYFSYGHLAVAAFIVLSGYCLQLSLFQSQNGKVSKLGKFYYRRAKRILPPYYACLALSVLVCYSVTSHQHGMPFDLYLPVNSETVLSHVFLVHNLAYGWMYKINGVLWSIAIEAQLYVVFPILVAFMNRAGRILPVVVSGLFTAWAVTSLPNAPKMYAWYVPLFVVGMAAAHYAYRPHLRIGPQPFLAKVLCLIALFSTTKAIHSGQLIESDIPFGVAVASLCYFATLQPRTALSRVFSLRPLVALGYFSYSLYLMHHPIMQVIYAYRPKSVQGPEAILTYLADMLPLTVLGCWVFSLLFERPFIKKSVPRKLSKYDVFTLGSWDRSPSKSLCQIRHRL